MLLLLVHRPAAAVLIGPRARPQVANAVQDLVRARRCWLCPSPSAAAFHQNWLYSGAAGQSDHEIIRSLLVLCATYCSTAARQGSTISWLTLETSAARPGPLGAALPSGRHPAWAAEPTRRPCRPGVQSLMPFYAVCSCCLCPRVSACRAREAART